MLGTGRSRYQPSSLHPRRKPPKTFIAHALFFSWYQTTQADSTHTAHDTRQRYETHRVKNVHVTTTPAFRKQHKRFLVSSPTDNKQNNNTTTKKLRKESSCEPPCLAHPRSPPRKKKSDRNFHRVGSNGSSRIYNTDSTHSARENPVNGQCNLYGHPTTATTYCTLNLKYSVKLIYPSTAVAHFLTRVEVIAITHTTFSKDREQNKTNRVVSHACCNMIPHTPRRIKAQMVHGASQIEMGVCASTVTTADVTSRRHRRK